MGAKKRSRVLSVILVIVVTFTMLFVDCGAVSAETEDKVVAIKYLVPSKITIEENTNGEWNLDKNGKLYYHYWEHFYSPEAFTAIYESGKTESFTRKGGHGDSFVYSASYESDKRRITIVNFIKSNQEEEHFTVGSDNYFTFEFEGVKIKIPVTVTPQNEKKTNVAEIEYEPVVKEVGYSDDTYSSVYNPKKDIEQDYFYGYSYNQGDKLTVTYKDGSKKVYIYGKNPNYDENDDESLSYAYICDNKEILPGGYPNISDDQKSCEWGPDRECYYIVEYGGAFTKVPITIKENDVESISIYIGTDSEPPELSCDANVYYDGTDDSGMRVIDGIVVHKTDGTNENIAYKQDNWIDDEGVENGGYYEQEGFFDEKGNEVRLSIEHLKMNESGQWFVSYHGVYCEIPTVHSNVSWKVKEKPTCCKAGVYEKVCACGEVLATEAIPIDKDAHKFTKYVYNNDAKVGVDGTETAVCDYGCGAKDTRTKSGSALGSGGSSGGNTGGTLPPSTTEQKPVVSEGEGYSTFIGDNGKTVLIVTDEDYDIKDVKVNGVSKGALRKVTSLKSSDKVEVFVIKKSEVIKGIKEQLETVSKENFKVSSAQVKMKSGKKAIKITWRNTSGAKFDGVQIFRSTKKNSGYGKKPIYTSKSGKFYNTSIKKSKRYYYKVRGYIEYDGIKYYSDWSTKTWRTAK